MARRLPYVLGLLILALLIAGPLAYATYRKHDQRNFRVVRAGVLYRSGQVTLHGLKRIVRDHAIKTVVTLRDARNPGDPPPDHEEETWCKAAGLTYYRLTPAAWSAGDGSVPAAKNVRRFREIVKDAANYPILVHCFAGRHRTGAYCAIYRMEQERWSNEEAIEDMVTNGYDLLDEHEDLREYLRQYRPTWRQETP
jgi:tyrosine-protein phosphatase SIW14